MICAAARPPPFSLTLFPFRPSIIGLFGMLLQTHAPEKMRKKKKRKLSSRGFSGNNFDSIQCVVRRLREQQQQTRFWSPLRRTLANFYDPLLSVGPGALRLLAARAGMIARSNALCSPSRRLYYRKQLLQNQKYERISAKLSKMPKRQLSDWECSCWEVLPRLHQRNIQSKAGNRLQRNGVCLFLHSKIWNPFV